MADISDLFRPQPEALADGAAQVDKGDSPDCLLVHGASAVQTTGGVTAEFRARLRRYVTSAQRQPGGTAFQLTLTTIAVLRGDERTALAPAQKKPEGYLHDTAMALALQIGSNSATADAALKTLIDKDASSAAYWVADVYLVRKDPDKGFQRLDRAWRNRDPQIPYMLFDPFLLPYKDDPRFASFCPAERGYTKSRKRTFNAQLQSTRASAAG